MANIIMADGGRRNQAIVAGIKSPTKVTVVPKKDTSTVLNKIQGPYIPGISDNPAALKSASGNVTTNKTFLPSTTPGKIGYYDSKGKVVTPPPSTLAQTKIVTGGKTGPVVDTKAGAAVKAAGGTTPTNTEIITTPAAGGSSSGSSMVQLSNGDIVRPELWSGSGLADHLGIVYDRAEIEKAMVDAARAKYANLDNEFGRTQDAYYDSVAGNADMLLGTLRRGDRQAAISGASSGSQAATQLSALLGIGQQNAQGATELAQGRGDLVTKRETEIADAKNKALKDYNDLGLTLGERISSIYNADMVGYSADQASNASTIAAQLAKEASDYAANQGLAGATAAANASIASSKNYNPAANVDPNVAKNQEIANLMAALNAPGIDDKTRKAIQDKLNGLMGVTVPVSDPKSNANLLWDFGPGTSYDPSSGKGYVPIRDR